jgi:hypothetical protein
MASSQTISQIALFDWRKECPAPYKIHTVLTDNGIQFTKREGTEAYWTIP